MQGIPGSSVQFTGCILASRYLLRISTISTTVAITVSTSPIQDITNGAENAAVNLQSGANLKDMVTLMAGVNIKSGQIVNYGETVSKEGKKNG